MTNPGGVIFSRLGGPYKPHGEKMVVSDDAYLPCKTSDNGTAPVQSWSLLLETLAQLWLSVGLMPSVLCKRWC